jgi:hypothetical protein
VVIDVSNPARPVQAGSWLAPTDRAVLQSITLAGHYAYVGDANGGAHVFDVADPPHPVRVGGFDSSGVAHEVAVAGNYAYVADDYQGLHVLDVSDAARPVLVGGWTNLASSAAASHVAVAGSYAYVMNRDTDIGLGNGGLDVIDISNPTNCTRVVGYTNISGEVALAGKYLCAAVERVGLRVLDVSNPTNCVWMGDYASNVQGGTAAGHYAYLAGAEGLQVIDISNPTNCVRVGGWVPDQTNLVAAMHVAVAGKYAYLAGFKGVGSPSNPSTAATLQVIDVSNPTNCVSVGGCYTTGETPSGVAVVGKYALVSVWPEGCQLIDVSNPTNCVRVGSYGGVVERATVAGNRIYLAEGSDGVEVLRSLPGVRFTLQVDGPPGLPLTVEAATNLVGAVQWTPLLTTNAASLPFDFVDYDVKPAEHPQKFYRVRLQP